MTERVRLSPSGRELDTSEQIADLQAQINVAQSEAAEALELAETAQTAAAAASAEAGSVAGIASAAEATAAAAAATAGAAQTTANAAQTTANAAQTAADAAAAAAFFPWYWGATAAPAIAAARYFQRNYGTVSGTESGALLPVAKACVIRGISVVVNVALVTDTCVFTLRRGAPGASMSNTAVTVTLNPGATTAVATGFNLALNQGDKLSMQVVQSGTEASVSWSGLVTLI